VQSRALADARGETWLNNAVLKLGSTALCGAGVEVFPWGHSQAVGKLLRQPREYGLGGCSAFGLQNP
jgi:hypothetical protein